MMLNNYFRSHSKFYLTPFILHFGKVFWIFFLLSITISAQVVIEERIEINGLHSESNIEKDAPASSLIMPISGMLQVYYTYLVHLDNPMPIYSSLDAYFYKGDSTKSDDLTLRFDDLFYWQHNFGPFCYPQYRWEYDYSPGEYLYELGYVNAGDTVQFTYYSDLFGEPFSYPIYIIIDSTSQSWDLVFGNPWCDYYENALYLTVGVMELDSIDVSISPAEISVGDTTQVIIKKRLPGGTLVDFDSTQTYEVAKLEGCLEGDILVGTETGAYFYDVHQPIYFVVADSLDGDSSGTVLLRVGLVEENDKYKKKFVLENLDSYECFTGIFNSGSFKDKSFPVGPSIKLIEYAANDNIEGNDPAMPEFPVQLEITNDTRGEFDFLRYYLFLEWKNTQQTGQPVYGGAVTKLEQLPSGGSPLIFDFNIDWDHPNPGFICGGDDLTLRIEYKGVKKDFKLNTDILGDNPTEKETFRTYVSTLLQEPDATFMNITIYYESRFRQFWTDHYVYMNTDNLPKVDWGVCQVRKIRPTIDEIWNWKENIISGVSIFEDNYELASTYPERVREGRTWYWDKNGIQQPRDPLSGHFDWYPEAYPNATDFDTEQVYKEMFQRYPGGIYWRWKLQDPKDLNSGKWEKSPSKDHNRGDEVWDMYQDMLIGIYPQDWN